MSTADEDAGPRPFDGASRLGDQAVAALHELARGFRAADDATSGELLGAALREDPDHVRGGLVATILRLAFLLHADARGLVSGAPSYAREHSVAAIHGDLRRCASRDPSGLGAPTGAWARVVALFRLVHDGAADGGLRVPARRGRLFDPEAWPFLEGRDRRGAAASRTALPLVPDEAVLRVIDRLALLDGAPIAYAEVDVEQLGTVHEAILGMGVAATAGPSVVVGPGHVAVLLSSILALAGPARLEALSDRADCRPRRAIREAVLAARTTDDLARALSDQASPFAPGVLRAGSLVVARTGERRRSGAHYTSRALAESVVDATIGPVCAAIGPAPTPDRLLAIAVCDPAMGSGAFVIAACRWLAARVAEARDRGAPGPSRADPRLAALRLVAARCLYGVDRSPFAVDVARLSLWIAVGDEGAPLTFVDHALRDGDALVGLADADLAPGLPAAASAERIGRVRQRLRAAGDAVDAPARGELLAELDAEIARARPPLDARVAATLAEPIEPAGRGRTSDGDDVASRALPFHWALELPEVFDAGADGGPGFSAFVGNPPWISYAGRAAQPLGAAVRRWFGARYRSFAGYRNLQGLFVERAAELLRVGGRLGLVLPSSMSEQAGYAPTRGAHDALAECDDDLPDLGEDAFAGVFQPCMVLRSTKRSTRREATGAAPWPVERPDLDEGARRLLAKLDRPPLPACLFGERGLQTSGEDVDHLARAPDARPTVALRAGGDVAPFRLGSPSYHADPAWFLGRLRDPEHWQQVRVLLRQTARVPMAALSDGVAFRNSVLAGFEDEAHPAAFLVAYLNSTPIRWLHYARHRDARQGMPQLKIGHLRATPAPDRALIEDLAAIGAELSARPGAVGRADQARLDARVADAFDLDGSERDRLRDWWARLA